MWIQCNQVSKSLLEKQQQQVRHRRAVILKTQQVQLISN